MFTFIHTTISAAGPLLVDVNFITRGYHLFKLVRLLSVETMIEAILLLVLKIVFRFALFEFMLRF